MTRDDETAEADGERRQHKEQCKDRGLPPRDECLQPRADRAQGGAADKQP
jgi:hypothetical protein